MISVIIVDYKTADRCIKYINDFCTASDEKQISFVLVDNSLDNINTDCFINGLAKAGFIEEKKLDNKAFLQISIYVRDGISVVYGVNSSNAGFATANNLGAKVAKELFNPDYLLFSNSDIQLDNRLEVSKLINKFSAADSIGLIGPRVVGVNGKVQSPGKYISIYKRYIIPFILWPLSNYLPYIKTISEDIYHKSEDGEVYRIIGAFMFFKADVFYTIGGFDEKTFLYAEELIMAEKLINAGYKTLYTNEVSIIHEQGASTTDKNSTMIENKISKRKRMYRSERYYYKHYKCYNKFSLGLADFSVKFYLFKLRIISKILLGNQK